MPLIAVCAARVPPWRLGSIGAGVVTCAYLAGICKMGPACVKAMGRAYQPRLYGSLDGSNRASDRGSDLAKHHVTRPEDSGEAQGRLDAHAHGRDEARPSRP